MPKEDVLLDRVAELMLQVFAENGLKASYIEMKREQFKGRNRIQCILDICNLDTDNKFSFARKIGVDPHALDVALDVFKKLA